MRAAVVLKAGVVEIQDRVAPELSPGSILVAPTLVGLCGSDLSYFRKGANGAFVIREPLTLGHEVTARVSAVAEDAAGGFSVGDRVVVHPAWPCPPAGQAVIPADRRDESPSFLGSASTSPHTHGALSELLAVRPDQLRRIPDTLPTSRAALTEPLSVVLHALDRHTDGYAGRRVLVCGAGPIGLLTVAALKKRGAAHVAITDVHARPLDVAALVGADATYNLSAADSVPADSFDIAVEATGVPASVNTALAALAPGGVLIQLGMLARDGVTADLGLLVVKELSMIGSHRFVGEFDAALEFLDAAPECDAIVTDVVGLDEIATALDRAGDAATSSKVLVAVGGSA